MNRIKRLFDNKTKDIFSVYFTAGFPTLHDTVPIITELEDAGVDMIEIGVPFSDPMADGVVIQNSSRSALNSSMTLRLLFEQLANVRASVTIPLIMMSYLNPIMQYGVESFCSKCAEVGIDGVIIPDLPFSDYIDHYKPIADKYDIKFIMLITPETSPERIRLIDRHTDSFIYMVSTPATTGTQNAFSQSTLDYFKTINAMGLHNPRLIGFGISTAQTLNAAFDNAAGAIIGSAFVTLLASSKTLHKAVEKLMEIKK